MMNKKIPRILFRFLQGIPELKIWNRSFFPSFENYAYMKHKLLLIKGMFLCFKIGISAITVGYSTSCCNLGLHMFAYSSHRYFVLCMPAAAMK